MKWRHIVFPARAGMIRSCRDDARLARHVFPARAGMIRSDSFEPLRIIAKACSPLARG